MPRLRLDLDRETFEALAAQARSERRSASFQAEVILRQALDLPFPYPTSSDSKSPTLPVRVSDE